MSDKKFEGEYDVIIIETGIESNQIEKEPNLMPLLPVAGLDRRFSIWILTIIIETLGQTSLSQGYWNG